MVQNIPGALDRKFLAALLLAIMTLAPVACSDNNNDSDKSKSFEKTQSNTGPSEKGTESTESKNTQKPNLEPLKKKLRIIGGGKIASPKINKNTIERIDPIKNAEEINAAEIAKIPKKPEVFHRPLVVSAGEIRFGDFSVYLKNIKAPEADETCQSVDGNWPCGNFAKAALQRLVRSRSLSCEGAFLKPGHYRGNCKIGNTDVASWLARQGWVKSAKGDLEVLLEKAKKAHKGIWRE